MEEQTFRFEKHQHLTRGSRRKIARGTLQIVGLVSILDIAVFSVAYVVSATAVVKLSSVVMMVESGVLLTIGGLADLTSSIFFGKLREHVLHSNETWTSKGHRQSQIKGLPYVLAGLIIFAASAIISLL